MTGIFKLFGARLAALALILALAGGAVYAQDESCPFGGYPDPEGGGCTYNISINVAYPTWLGESPAAQAAVNDILTGLREGFFADLSASYGEFFMGGALDVTYQEFEHGAALRSVVFPIYIYIGGAHGNTFFQSVTVDTIADRVLTLEGDIFQPGADFVSVLQPLVAAELAEQQGEYADAEWIASGTDEASDYTAWAINAGNLELFFGPYQVAAYAMGTFQVSIPVDALAGVINPMLIP